jgi:hypothetical protein
VVHVSRIAPRFIRFIGFIIQEGYPLDIVLHPHLTEEKYTYGGSERNTHQEKYTYPGGRVYSRCSRS